MPRLPSTTRVSASAEISTPSERPSPHQWARGNAQPPSGQAQRSCRSVTRSGCDLSLAHGFGNTRGAPEGGGLRLRGRRSCAPFWRVRRTGSRGLQWIGVLRASRSSWCSGSWSSRDFGSTLLLAYFVPRRRSGAVAPARDRGAAQGRHARGLVLRRGRRCRPRSQPPARRRGGSR